MKPQIVLYCCTNSTTFSGEDIEKRIPGNLADFKISRLPCSGRTDTLYMVRAIENGADMVMVIACPDGCCQFLEGNRRARMRVRYANRLLAEAGIGDDRIHMVNVDPADDQILTTALQKIVVRALDMGPWLTTSS